MRYCSDAVKTDLSKAGFVTNEDKSVWLPCQRLDWLGITWDSARGTIEIVDRRVAKITSTIDSIIDSDFVLCARRLASIFYRADNYYSSCFREHFQPSRLGTALCLHEARSTGTRELRWICITLRNYIFGKTV